MIKEERNLSKDLKRNLVVLALLCLLFSILAYYVYIAPRKTKQFIEFYILDKDRLAMDYLPKNGTVLLGTQVKWFNVVVNHMNSTKDIMIKVKLSNSTIPLPQRNPAEPAPAPSFLEFQNVLTVSERWDLPFFWSVEDASVVGDNMYITNMTINNQTIVDFANIYAFKGYGFRLIFELWTLDKQTNNYIFSWKTEEEGQIGVWLQMGFNITLPTST